MKYYELEMDKELIFKRTTPIIDVLSLYRETDFNNKCSGYKIVIQQKLI